MSTSNPFTTASKTWLEALKTKRTVSKKAKQAVIAFAMWLDQMTQDKERRENEEEN